MRFSQQRQIIKEIIFSTNSHPTADWVYTKAKTILPNISLGTVYRNLKSLQESGQIKALYTGNAVRYDGNISNHNHLECTECNELVDVIIPHENISKIVLKKYDFKVKGVDLTIIGKCAKHR